MGAGLVGGIEEIMMISLKKELDLMRIRLVLRYYE
jgi:hypothetical protein